MMMSQPILGSIQLRTSPEKQPINFSANKLTRGTMVCN
jgi:hypothetical protein